MEVIQVGAKSRLRKGHSTAMKLGKPPGTSSGISLCPELPERRFERLRISMRWCAAYADTIWPKPAWKRRYGISKRRLKTFPYGKYLADQTNASIVVFLSASTLQLTSCWRRSVPS